MTEELDMQNIPTHIAIIMDGNGRWATAKGLPRSAGHAEGVESINCIAAECARLGVKYMTAYAFSTENWNRPTPEVEALMGLVITQLQDEIFMKNNIRLRVIGDIERLPENVQKRLNDCMEVTAGNDRMTLVVALSYSSRWEITNLMKESVLLAAEGKLQAQDVTEEYITNHLQTNFMPDPDLLIRTGGEQRISNYLLWQCAYSEFYYCDTFWPDFREEHLHKAIADYQTRQRRFGKTGQQVVDEKRDTAQ